MQFGQIERSFLEDDLWSLCSSTSCSIDSDSLRVEDESAKPSIETTDRRQTDFNLDTSYRLQQSYRILRAYNRGR